MAGNLEVKEVGVDGGTMRDRFVICKNPDQAERDQAVRDQLIVQLEDEIKGSDELSATERSKLVARLQTKRGLERFLRQTPGGLLRVDRAAVRAEQHLDGKFLLRSSDPTLTAEDIALGYKQLLQVERGWRDMKTTLDLRPVYHRKEPDPRPRPTLLAGAAADPDRREPDRRHMAQRAPRAPTPAPRHLRRHRRPRAEDQRAHHRATTDPASARDRRTAQLPSA